VAAKSDISRKIVVEVDGFAVGVVEGVGEGGGDGGGDVFGGEGGVGCRGRAGEGAEHGCVYGGGGEGGREYVPVPPASAQSSAE